MMVMNTYLHMINEQIIQVMNLGRFFLNVVLSLLYYSYQECFSYYGHFPTLFYKHELYKLTEPISKHLNK